MPEKKKDLKKKYAKEGYKTKVKTSRQGQEARMAKRGYIAVTSVGIGTARNESPTGPKPGELGGHVIKTIKRATVYQKMKPPPTKKKKQRPMF